MYKLSVQNLKKIHLVSVTLLPKKRFLNKKKENFTNFERLGLYLHHSNVQLN